MPFVLCMPLHSESICPEGSQRQQKEGFMFLEVDRNIICLHLMTCQLNPSVLQL